MIRDHWFRADYTGQPCAYQACGRPRAEHVEACGEWMGPRHWFRPTWRRPSQCARCDRPFAHSTHHGSRKNWRMWHRDSLLYRLDRARAALTRRAARRRADRALYRLARKDRP
ncbi:hypothetical protein [Streptomyces sp. NPDC003278]|uniref:hypothetical protein n=1 Tax=Streptomyces sp. NPDC003278 TaxID=3364679 RepID=UPI00369DC86C